MELTDWQTKFCKLWAASHEMQQNRTKRNQRFVSFQCWSSSEATARVKNLMDFSGLKWDGEFGSLGYNYPNNW